MIDLKIAIWISVGSLVGMLHAVMIWKTVQWPTAHSALLGMVRLIAVAGLLFFAALHGVILPVAAGWFIAFGFLCMWFAIFGKPRGNSALASTPKEIGDLHGS